MLVLASGIASGVAVSQERSTAMIIRQQFASIADEVVQKLQPAHNANVGITVEANRYRSLAENAFLQSLQQKGYSASLGRGRDSDEAVLDVNVLTDQVAFEGIGQRGYARTVQTGIEARVEYPKMDSAAVLGLFQRISRDTVAQRDPGIPVTSGALSYDEESSIFQRFLGPLIVLASSIVVVYLFFTVRS